MNTFVLPIGDWSKDGHNQIEEFTVAVNKTKQELIEAYHKTTKLLNMTFDTNDMQESNPIRLINEYGDSTIKKSVMDILVSNGVNLDVVSFDGEYEGVYSMDPEQAAYLFMEFIKISLPDMKYEMIESQNDYLFGYWGDLNISVGYGVFTDGY